MTNNAKGGGGGGGGKNSSQLHIILPMWAIKEEAKSSPLKIQVKGPHIPLEEDYQVPMPLQQTVVQELNLQSQQKVLE
jgi:hypothetical protein